MCFEVKRNDKVKYTRNKKTHVLKVYEIGNSYGNKKIYYNYDGGFCMEDEVIKVCKNKSKKQGVKRCYI